MWLKPVAALCSAPPRCLSGPYPRRRRAAAAPAVTSSKGMDRTRKTPDRPRSRVRLLGPHECPDGFPSRLDRRIGVLVAGAVSVHAPPSTPPPTKPAPRAPRSLGESASSRATYSSVASVTRSAGFGGVEFDPQRVHGVESEVLRPERQERAQGPPTRRPAALSSHLWDRGRLR